MSTETSAPRSKGMFWLGVVLSVLPILMLVMSGVMKFVKPPAVMEGMVKAGYPTEVLTGLGVVELVSTALYAIPTTAVLGAILLTGYLGGAIATHVRIGEPYWIPILLGVMIWGGLYLRCGRIRELLPWRTL